VTAAPDERDEDFVEDEEAEAAREAAGIGGTVPHDTDDPSQQPLIEGGEGESEGFELSEMELEEHASHGDEHSAGRIIEDAALYDEDEESERGSYGEADEERDPDA
jgi:hypothetical protein